MGVYAPGVLMGKEGDGSVNIYDISKQAGVSIATVSRVLNNSPHVSPKTREKVLAVIDGCGYVPNAFARGLGLNTMKTIGLLCPDASDPYQAHALACLERAFRERQYNCLLVCTGRDLRARVEGVEQLKARHVDGMVLMGSSFVEDKEKDNDYIAQAGKEAPVVLLNGSFVSENVYSVTCDDQRATEEATLHLLQQGCRRILYLYHSCNNSGRRKLAGYVSALEAYGIAVDERLLRLFEKDRRSIQGVCDELTQMEKDGIYFDGVVTSEDSLAFCALKYARASGRRVPEDLCVMGYNNSHFCQCCEPELSSVDNRLSAICDHIVETMMGVLEGRAMPQKTIFTAEIVRRRSTRNETTAP